MTILHLANMAAALALAATAWAADEATPAAAAQPLDPVAEHHQGATKVANDQDELAADVQQLTLEQTIPKVIALFQEVEHIMDETTDWLADYDTGGGTLAAQTEVIEKIFEATKERQKQQGAGKSGGAMMEMMEKMLEQGEGKEGGKKPGKGQKPGDQGGQGMTGGSDAANDPTGAAGDGKNQARRIPKAAGTAGHALPEEFRKALDAYNRGLEKKVK
ncbi:MAG: hypothetical protein DVB25_01435 [Verrucomicrobia bacterium]|nr:MAG: hypothetical protein DVB25_01435 [Verrucomicrobiota bacterium]